jgi:phage repressor protein C with HTH and peptisase S24 domain
VVDIYETRRARLRELIDTKFGGKQVGLATAIERQPDYISRCLKGTKRIGEDFARFVEQQTEMPVGWLDRPDVVLIDSSGHTAAVIQAKTTASSAGNLTLLGEPHTQAQMLSLRPGEMWLPQYEGVRAMMGEGSDGASDVVTLVRVSKEGLRRRLIRTTFTSLKNLKLLSAYGDSMAGTFEDGDVLLVDSGVSAIDRDGVYVYSRDGELLVKRLQREDDGSLTVISDNPRYRDRRIARGDRAAYQVHGRALLAWTAKVL